MAYNDYSMGGYIPEDYETEEERRRRLEREAAYGAAQDAEDAALGAAMTANAAAPAGGGFMDAVGNYAQRRFDQAVQPFVDPAAALNRRLGMTPEDAANTEIQSTQVKTYGDGSQEEIVKRQIPAAAAPAAAPVNPAEMGVMPTGQAQPQPQPQPQQRSPEEIARNAQALREMAQGRAAPPPQAAPAGFSPEEQAQAQAEIQQQIQQIPRPGPGVQVAGPMVPGAVPPAAPVAPAQAVTATGQPVVGAPQTAANLAQAGAQAQAAPVAPTAVSTAPAAAPTTAAAPAAAPAPAATQPAWMAAANAAGTNFEELLKVAAQFPESIPSLKEKMKTALDNQRKEAEAIRDIEAAARGDIRAQNRVNQALRPETGRQKEEVTTGDYVKAYLYARLGLNELAAEAQRKIIGKDTKFGQVTMPDGSNWDVERDSSGRIVSAKDNQGTVATESILNRIRADSRTVSTATPPSATSTRIRDSQGKEWSQVPTPQGMRFYDNEGKSGVPQGRTVPITVGSDLEIAQAQQDIQTVARFSQQTAQQRLAAYANTNKLRADRNLPQLSLAEMGLNADGSLVGEAVRRPGEPISAAPAPAAPAPVVQRPVTPAPAAPAPVVQRPVTPAPAAPAAPAANTTPLVSTAGPTAGGAGAVRTPAGGIPTAQQMEAAGKEGDVERNVREAEIKDRNKSNREFSDALATKRENAVAQTSTINRLQSSIDRNPEFWGIDTNSTAWRAYVDINSTNADKAEALNTLARNLNIPAAKRAQFDQTMNDYRNLQVNAVTGSGLTASQTNTERESQRVMGTIGSISDRPAAAKATLEYAKAKIEYTDAKARAWAEARRKNPGIDRLAFEANFDATTGEKIFKDANERMSRILGAAPGAAGAGPVAGATKIINGVTYVYDGRGWKPK
jgi:YD repeat-containing protein